jgi:hypothetical protein
MQKCAQLKGQSGFVRHEGPLKNEYLNENLTITSAGRRHAWNTVTAPIKLTVRGAFNATRSAKKTPVLIAVHCTKELFQRVNRSLGLITVPLQVCVHPIDLPEARCSHESRPGHR